jgi:hypothetical protein
MNEVKLAAGMESKGQDPGNHKFNVPTYFNFGIVIPSVEY